MDGAGAPWDGTEGRGVLSSLRPDVGEFGGEGIGRGEGVGRGEGGGVEWRAESARFTPRWD